MAVEYPNDEKLHGWQLYVHLIVKELRMAVVGATGWGEALGRPQHVLSGGGGLCISVGSE